MRKITTIIVTMVILIMTSCSGILSKSIMEPLTTKELSSVIKEKQGFGEFYERVTKIVNRFSDVEKAKYSDVSYESLWDCAEYIGNFSKQSEKISEWKTQWEQMFQNDALIADTIIRYWKVNWKSKDIPKSVQKYTENEGKASSEMKENYKAAIIKELVNNKYVTCSDYCISKMEQDIKAKYPLEFDFLNKTKF